MSITEVKGKLNLIIGVKQNCTSIYLDLLLILEEKVLEDKDMAIKPNTEGQ